VILILIPGLVSLAFAYILSSSCELQVRHEEQQGSFFRPSPSPSLRPRPTGWNVSLVHEQKPLEFSIVERYEDQAAIDAHVQSRYYVETGAFLKEHIDKFSLEL
jgi:hypothetical protein